MNKGMHRSVHKALSLPVAVCSSVKNRMGIIAKLLFVALVAIVLYIKELHGYS